MSSNCMKLMMLEKSGKSAMLCGEDDGGRTVKMMKYETIWTKWRNKFICALYTYLYIHTYVQ